MVEIIPRDANQDPPDMPFRLQINNIGNELKDVRPRIRGEESLLPSGMNLACFRCLVRLASEKPARFSRFDDRAEISKRARND
jgi:hypothetical protein